MEDFEEAYYWYEQAAQNSHLEAQKKIVEYYKQNDQPQLALEYYKELANTDINFYFDLVECYEELGDYDNTLKYLLEAYSKGLRNTEIKIAQTYHEKLNKSFEALEWLNDNDIEHIKYKGKIFDDLKDYQKACNYYLQAAQAGDAESMYNMAFLLNNYLDNRTMGQYWYERAEDNGYEDDVIDLYEDDDDY